MHRPLPHGVTHDPGPPPHREQVRVATAVVELEHLGHPCVGAQGDPVVGHRLEHAIGADDRHPARARSTGATNEVSIATVTPAADRNAAVKPSSAVQWCR